MFSEVKRHSLVATIRKLLRKENLITDLKSQTHTIIQEYIFSLSCKLDHFSEEKKCLRLQKWYSLHEE
jgi:hypothetical protein